MTARPRFTRRTFLMGAAGAAAVSRRRGGAAAMRSDYIRGIYVNPYMVDDQRFAGLLDLVDRTELNAMVIDVKADSIFVPTSVPLFVESGQVNLETFDVLGALEEMNARGIYAIARVVTFRDEALARYRPDLAVQDYATGGPWEAYDGLTWLNPLKEETWDATASFAEELVGMGFDEVQFDYVRFPSDGDLQLMDFGADLDGDAMCDTIAAFLGYGRDRISRAGGVTAADVFGYTLLADDIGIGQDLRKIAPNIDVICPMTYPSHYPEQSVAVPGHPNDHPWDTIQISLERGSARAPVTQMRPWLQDFSLEGLRDYGAADVRAQIGAAEEMGAPGWMLWSILSEFTVDALATG